MKVAQNKISLFALFILIVFLLSDCPSNDKDFPIDAYCKIVGKDEVFTGPLVNMITYGHNSSFTTFSDAKSEH
ncbi:hypothetical protein [Flavobacterium lindanitolerans]|uniref:Uncharacterized protein n=1 Tax=Flavobacterium lindanitolerans TaxID=428988 RepID=A0A497UP45_9FLAO|nr:hypothetical protein [Flavobacterium lindanitolerans]MBC8644383.1 hypothetical protein [Flavobacterium lindanitolerans]PKW21083.1 hypothetical protein B0G92_2364 [Flavobacterium lindanitolerans]RLJ30278.1 hypothetical protein CLV50_1686 [Flavobacterium lindanitolerans]